MNNIPISGMDIGRIETYMLNLKPIKRTLRNAGFVLDDFATHIDKKQLSFRHPYIYRDGNCSSRGDDC